MANEQTIPERMRERIASAFRKGVGDEDYRVLGFIYDALAPDAIAARNPEDEGKSVTHLIEGAQTRLKPYERKES